MEYAACAWLVEKKPVWSIVFFTDGITEHYEHIGEQRGKKLGKKLGEQLGELRKMVEVGQEQLDQYETLLAEGHLSEGAYTRLVQPLKAKVAAAEAELQALKQAKRAQSA